MNKELEAFEEIKNHKIKLDVNIKYDNGNETQYRFETIKDMFPKQFAIIETAFKALEIIKEHKLLNYVLKNEKCANMYHLSKEEKDLLKKAILWIKN